MIPVSHIIPFLEIETAILSNIFSVNKFEAYNDEELFQLSFRQYELIKNSFSASIQISWTLPTTYINWNEKKMKLFQSHA